MLEFSPLNKTWIFDIDGSIVKHNGYKIDGYDSLLEGVSEFFSKISQEDKIIMLTARKGEELENLKAFFKENHIRFDYILTDMPLGERILINDEKPSGLKTAFAITKKRDSALNIAYKINESL